MIKIIEDRLLQTMMNVLRMGGDPEPMLAFCRGEVDLGVISGPEMPRDKAQRFDTYRAWASFMTMYGATEAVFIRDVVISSVDLDTDPAMVSPNDDPAARTALQIVRFPSTYTSHLWYHLDDQGEVVWDGLEDRGTSEETGIQFLQSSMGWAPVDRETRVNAPKWLREKAPGATVGLMPPALE